MLLMLSLVGCGGDFSKGDKLILLADYADQRIGYMEVTVQDVEDKVVVKVDEIHEEKMPGYKQGDLISVSKDKLYPLSEGLELAKKRKQFYNELRHNQANLDVDKMKSLAKDAKLSEMGAYLTALASVNETELMWKKMADSPDVLDPDTFECDFSSIDSAATGKQLDQMSGDIQQYLSEVRKMPYVKGTALVDGDSYGYKKLPLTRSLIKQTDQTFAANDGVQLAYLASRVCENHPVDGKLLADKILEADQNIKASEQGLTMGGKLKAELDKILEGYRAAGIYRLVIEDIATIDTAIKVVSQDPKKAESLFTYDPAYKKNIEKKMASYGITRFPFREKIEEKVAVYLKRFSEYQKAKVDYAEKQLKSMVVEGKSLEGVKNATNLLGKDLSLDDSQIQGIEGKIPSWFKQKAKLAARRAKIEKITKELKAHKWVGATRVGPQIIHIDFNVKQYENESILKFPRNFSNMDFHFDYKVNPRGNIIIKNKGKKWKSLLYKDHTIIVKVSGRYGEEPVELVSEEKYERELKKVDALLAVFAKQNRMPYKLDKRSSFVTYLTLQNNPMSAVPMLMEKGRWIGHVFYAGGGYFLGDIPKN